MERLHGPAVKALANHFGGPGSIPSTGCSESEPGCEIFAPVPDAALNCCDLHVKPDFNFTLDVISIYKLCLRVIRYNKTQAKRQF